MPRNATRYWGATGTTKELKLLQVALGECQQCHKTDIVYEHNEIEGGMMWVLYVVSESDLVSVVQVQSFISGWKVARAQVVG